MARRDDHSRLGKLANKFLAAATGNIERVSAVLLHDVLWNARHADKYWRWCKERSSGRRWLPTQGEEWGLIAHCASFTAAHHTLRLLAGGLGHGARTRDKSVRGRCPRKCVRCEGAVAVAWLTPHPDAPGLAWCGKCAGDHGILDRGGAAGGSVAEEAILRTKSGPYPVCPLCGEGETGAEHCIRWCKVARGAWTELVGDPDAVWGNDLCVRGPRDALMARFCHQVAYLHVALEGKVVASRALGRLVAATRYRLKPAGAEVGDVGFDVEDDPDPGRDTDDGEKEPRGTLSRFLDGRGSRLVCVAGAHLESNHVYGPPASVLRVRSATGRRIGIGLSS